MIVFFVMIGLMIMAMLCTAVVALANVNIDARVKIAELELRHEQLNIIADSLQKKTATCLAYWETS
jgi:hypothetical protein